MSKIKRMQPAFLGGIPLAVGDRYYAQDLTRDFWAGLDFQSTMMRAITNLTPQLLRGGYCTKGTAFDDMNITAAFGLAGYAVTTPDDFSSLPPTTQSEDILAMIVESTQQVNLDLSATATLDGVTTNYVKLRYKDDDGASRNRAKKAGSYVYEVEASFEIIVDSVAPTIYDCLLCSFVGDGASVLTITQEPPYFLYEATYQDTETIDVGNAKNSEIIIDVTGGDSSCPIANPSYAGQKIHIVANGTGLADVSGTGLYVNGLYITEDTGGIDIESIDNGGLEWVAETKVGAITTVGSDYYSNIRTDGRQKISSAKEIQIAVNVSSESIPLTWPLPFATGNFPNAVYTIPGSAVHSNSAALNTNRPQSYTKATNATSGILKVDATAAFVDGHFATFETNWGLYG